MRRASELACGPERRSVRVGRDAGRGDVLIQERLQLVMAGNFVFLAAFFVQSHPAAASLRKVVADFHLQHRTDVGEGVDHSANEYAVAQAGRDDTPEQIWRDYNRRADMENRIAELKHDLCADCFCMKQFYATEAAFRTILLLFNLLSEFQRATGLGGYREPGSIRTQVLLCGAILGRAGRRLVLFMGKSWGGLDTRIPLLENLLHWQIPTSPKLAPALQA